MGSAPRVGFSEALSITVIFLTAKIFISHLALLFPLGLTASWIIPLIHLVIGLVAFIPLAWLLNQFPGRTIVEIGEELVGPVVNSFFALAYYAFFVIATALTVRQFAEFLLTGFFPETPISAAILIALAGTTVMAYLGLEVIVRVARFLIFFLGILLVALLLMTANLWEPHGIEPLLGPGPGKLLWAAISTLGVGVEIFILAMIAPYLPRGRLLAIGLLATVISAIAVTLTILAIQLVFPYPVVREPILPVFELARSIDLRRFVTRLETFFLPLWIFTGMIAVAASTYIATSVAARALKLPYHQPLIPATMVLILAGTFFPPNFPTAVELGFTIIVRLSFVFLGVIIGILILATLVRKRRRKSPGKRGKGSKK